MNWKNLSNQPTYGVIGSGKFGTAISNILAENGLVYLYTRRESVVANITEQRFHCEQKMHPNICPTQSLEEVCEKCTLIFPIVPSANFRSMVKSAASFLMPHHILIHGTKGLNVVLPKGEPFERGKALHKEHILTMTDIIRQESNVIRVGCLSGPNLAMELAAKEPAATVVASHFKEVIDLGKAALKSNRFRVYGTHDVIGVELAGVLKNIMAIASGVLHGLGFGENAKAMLITRGLGEMVKVGTVLGANTSAFFGLAGIGDLIATCSSTLSRNFTVGYRLAKGETFEEILSTMKEVVEGIKTIQIVKGITLQYQINVPIVEALYNILFNGESIENSLTYLMTHPLDIDADFQMT